MRYLAIEKKIVTGLTMVLVSILATLSVAPGSASAGARFDLATLWLQGDSDAIGVQAYGDDGGEAAERALRVSVWHGREEDEHYQRGDELDVFFRTNQDVYAVVYRIDADGAVEVLWPTSRYDDGFAYGGHSYRLPPDGSRVPLRVANQKGVEYLQAIASEYPFDLRDLAIDFAFDPDQSERYDYEVAGDPFLAVNEINYAITGLDEDSEFVVTDWSHFYVEGKVDYARYSCRQCHTNDDDYHPYVDTCSQITIRHDFGWNNSWYDRYGYYPIYYDPLYTYWDLVSYRPYYNWYYPVCYTWPSYYSRPYYRPYRVYYWQDSNYFAGNYRTRYRRGGVGSRPLYDVTRPDGSSRVRGVTRRDTQVTSRSEGRGDRVIARNHAPITSGRGVIGTARDTRRSGDRRGARRASIRERTQRGDRTVTSLAPLGATRVRSPRNADTVRGTRRVREGDAATGRSWTRPVVRNRDDSPRSTTRPRPTVRDRSAETRRGSAVQRGDKPRVRSGERKPTVRSNDRGRSIKRDDKKATIKRGDRGRTIKRDDKKPTVKRGERKPTVKRGERKKGKGKGGGSATVQRNSTRRSSEQRVTPRSAPRKTQRSSAPTVKRKSGSSSSSRDAKARSSSGRSSKGGGKSRSKGGRGGKG